MGSMILTYNDLDALNQFLKEKGINFSVHMHDLCGSQSFTIKAPVMNPEELNAAENLIVNYFDTRGIIIRFSEDSRSFVLSGLRI